MLTSSMKISGSTMLVGVIGWPIAYSKSPAMHNAAAADLGLNLVYLPLAVHPAALDRALPGLVALGFRGVNITVPYKEAVLPFLDQIHPAASAIGAVNTIVVGNQWSVVIDRRLAVGGKSSLGSTPDPQLIGFNTDWEGFMADLAAHKLKPQNLRCLILGAGGAARAVAYGLASAGNEVHIVGRRVEQARKLVRDVGPNCPKGELKVHLWQSLHGNDDLLSEIRMIVNCTPVGMAPDADNSPWPEGLVFPTEAFVYDLVYNPAETTLMQQARNAGCRSANGLGMLIQQGAIAFQLWTGKSSDLQIMASAIT